MSSHDPYLWLEDNDSKQVLEWTAAQNRTTRRMLDGLPYRRAVSQRLAQLWEPLMETGVAWRHARTFLLQREGAMEQPVLTVREPDGTDRVLIDPVATGPTSRVIDWWYPSPSGRFVAYGISDHGNEQSVLYVLEVDTGRLLSDRIPWTRQCSLAWEPDDGGFFYTRHPAPESVATGEANYHRHVFYHRLGSDPIADEEVFGEGRPRTHMPELGLSLNGRWLLITVHCSRPACDDELFVLDRTTRKLISLSGSWRARYTAAFRGDEVLLCTNLDAPHGKLVAIDPQCPEPSHWRPVVSEHPQWVMMAARATAKHLWISWLDGATAVVTLHEPDGRLVGRVHWPDLGTVENMIAYGEKLGCIYQSFSLPPRAYVVAADELVALPLTAAVAHDRPTPLEVSVMGAQSTGVSVPFFLVQASAVDGHAGVRNSGMCVDGAALLTGYGGMHVPSTPRYNPSLITWCEAGGRAAVANLRGGCELGEEWHLAGRKDLKENVFQDFAAVAEFLVAHGNADRGKVVIHGRSNGGLLVGDAVVRNPDLFAAAACGVPLLDMLRFHLFLIADIWTEEYGNPDDPMARVWLAGYSPYHRIEAERRYPPVLFYTAAQDSRVHPMHARKMTARMQDEAQGGPFLLRVEDEAGHGIGKPVGQIVDEQADVLSFLCSHVCSEE